MKVRVPPIGIEIEGIVHRSEEYMGHASTYDLKERVQESLGKFVSFEGGYSNSGARLFEVKTNPSTDIEKAAGELPGHTRHMLNVMSEYHREVNSSLIERQREIDADIADMDENEKQEYFMYIDRDGEDENDQRLFFAGSIPRAGDGYNVYNSEKYGGTHEYAAGLHLHAGVPFEEQEAVAKKLEPYAPLLTALTASSPFDHHGNPEWASFRMMCRADARRGDVPKAPYFYRHGESFEGGAKLSRPETVECVVMDSTSRLEDIACVAAIYQGLVCKAMQTDSMDCKLEGAEKIDLEHTGNMSRVCKDGLDAELLCTDGSTLTAREAVSDMLNELSPYLRAIGTEEIARHAETIMREGTSADRQVKLYKDESRKFEVDGRREELLEELSQRVFSKPFEGLSAEEHRKMFKNNASYDGSEAIYMRQKTAAIADVVERSLVRESLGMAREGRGKQTEEHPYGIKSRESSIVSQESIEAKLLAQGQVLEVEVDLSQQNDEPEKEHDTFTRA